MMKISLDIEGLSCLELNLLIKNLLMNYLFDSVLIYLGEILRFMSAWAWLIKFKLNFLKIFIVFFIGHGILRNQINSGQTLKFYDLKIKFI